MADLWVRDPGPQVIQVIKIIRELCGCGLKEAKECAEGKRAIFLGNPTREAEINIDRQLTAAGVRRLEIVEPVQVDPLKPTKDDPFKSVKTWHERLLEDD